MRLVLVRILSVKGVGVVAGARFVGDPLVGVSERFPLAPSGCAVPASSESPSGPGARPFGLRWVSDVGVPTPPTSYRYCPVRQVAVDVVTGVPLPPLAKLEWTTINHKDGDEGPSKDYDWETIPDFTG
nr:putative ATP-grasp-modified RiPP [Amycolatopsis cihanbeyliensis]